MLDVRVAVDLNFKLIVVRFVAHVASLVHHNYSKLRHVFRDELELTWLLSSML